MHFFTSFTLQSLYKLYRKAHTGMLEYKHFTMHRWTFKNGNLKALFKSLTDSDRETFDFDIWHVSNNLFKTYQPFKTSE